MEALNVWHGKSAHAKEVTTQEKKSDHHSEVAISFLTGVWMKTLWGGYLCCRFYFNSPPLVENHEVFLWFSSFGKVGHSSHCRTVSLFSARPFKRFFLLVIISMVIALSLWRWWHFF